MAHEVCTRVSPRIREDQRHGASDEERTMSADDQRAFGVDCSHEDALAQMEPCVTIEDARSRIASMYAGDGVSAEDIEVLRLVADCNERDNIALWRERSGDPEGVMLIATAELCLG